MMRKMSIDNMNNKHFIIFRSQVNDLQVWFKFATIEEPWLSSMSYKYLNILCAGPVQTMSQYLIDIRLHPTCFGRIQYILFET